MGYKFNNGHGAYLCENCSVCISVGSQANSMRTESTLHGKRFLCSDCTKEEDKKLKPLLFENLEFLENSDNSTVRLGAKWVDRVNVGDMVPIAPADEPGQLVGSVGISGIWCGPLCDIPSKYLLTEHDESCRTTSGLLQTMQEIYGSSVSRYSTVTALMFTIL